MRITPTNIILTGLILLAGAGGYIQGRNSTQTVAERDIAQRLGTQEYIDFIEANTAPDEFRKRKAQINLDNLNHRYLAPFDWHDYAVEVGHKLKAAKDKLTLTRLINRAN